MPTNGLTFYHPLSTYTLKPTVGNTLTLTGNAPTPTTFNGIKCLQFSNGALIQDEIDGYINFTEPEVTMSIWANSTPSSTFVSMFALGAWNNYQAIEILRRYGFLMVSCGSPDRDMTGTITNDKWYHLAFTFFKSGSNYVVRIYRDGAFINQYTQNGSSYNIQKCLGIGRNFSGSGYPNFRDGWFPGYLAGARIYNRALTDEEIALLATELTPHYTITASDLLFSLYQKNETYSISYTSPGGQPTFEIIEGTLPNTITFNTSTGQFTGKGLTDADHTYNLKVRLTAPNITPAECNVTIHTYKTARISMSNQTFSFISNKAENKAISYTSDKVVTFTIESGTLPAGMSLSSGKFFSAGTNTSAENKQVVVRATSANNQTGVTATMTLNMQMNAIICSNQTFKFYTAQGVKSKAVAYSGSLNTVSDAVFSMTGTLPTGVTFDSTTGTFTSDGTQTADETASVSITVSSSNGTSTSATATVTLEVHEGAAPIPDDYTFYQSFSSSVTVPEVGSEMTIGSTAPTLTVVDGISCAYFNGGGVYKTGTSYWNTSSTVVAFSFWCKTNPDQSAGSIAPMAGGKWVYRQAFDCLFSKYNANYRYVNIAVLNYRYPTPNSFHIDTSWHHYCIMTTGSGNAKIYIDGNYLTDEPDSAGLNIYNNLGFGSNFSSSNAFGRDGYSEFYIAGARVYNRVLTADEIEALASEFTPTT